MAARTNFTRGTWRLITTRRQKRWNASLVVSKRRPKSRYRDTKPITDLFMMENVQRVKLVGHLNIQTIREDN